ncbi:penicillin-binding transpeptidase domain-containing protein [Rhizohabitans arisaemae]|uniref:penicillin-binding transpeptidase domain-containing protein n=1 Tax=Rhizohabitans arisaemae TaxID=2720610 RepID=UPI0024B17533|nr:penicillin-binding transpeptidase domain-containing protein [Rhizohabitans arisaemae]
MVRASRRGSPAPRRRRLLAATLACTVTGTTLTGCFAEPSPQDAVKQFLVGWQNGAYDEAARRTDADPKVVAKALEQASFQLDVASFRFSLLSLNFDGENAEARFESRVDLGENGPPWTYQGKLPLRLIDGAWKVRWSPEIIHPQLKPGQRLAVIETPAYRQAVEDRTGKSLQENATIYVAGVYPAKLKNPATTATQLAKVTGFAQDRLLGKIRSAPPNDFVALATFDRARYGKLSSGLGSIPGLTIAEDRAPVAPTHPVHIVGTVGAVTPQQLGGPHQAGDTVGKTGLQRRYEDRLAGSTSVKVVTLDGQGREVATLASWEAKKNAPVKTTIDSAVEAAAQQSILGQFPTALVAVEASTGRILAIGSNGDLHQERDVLAGRYPPGTAFSIITMEALLKAGVKLNQPIPCPPNRTVGGERFSYTGPVNGTTPTLRDNFRLGCGTAFAGLSRRVSGAALNQAAAKFGMATDWNLPLKSFSGALPAANGEAAEAGIMTGQTVRVSPLAMALVAGAVATGRWRPPQLVTQPAPDGPKANEIPLDPVATRALQVMMGATMPGPAAGITSSVTYTERGERAKQLSWFVGWQGDIAISVLVGTGPSSAAQAIANRFFTAVENSPSAEQP